MVRPRPALGAGDRLGPYRLVREIGRGAMGCVFEAVEESLHRVVAVKLISPELADDPAFRAELHREAQAQAALDSPHVVPVLAHGEADGHLYLTTRFVPDGDLAGLLDREGPLPPRVAVDLAAQVADGLAEAHRLGIVHRDIKPANVLLRRRGDGLVGYLTDFGIALAGLPGRAGRSDRAVRDVIGVGAGTPAYLAPEVYAGGPATPASDIYALGCLLRAALTGVPPYSSTSGHGLAEAHRTAPIPLLGGRTGLERAVDAVLLRALAKDPADRHSCATALRDELYDALALPPACRRWRTDRSFAVAAVVTILLGSGVTGGAIVLQRPDGHRLAARLHGEAGLDPATAECTARRSAGRSAELFAAAYECLWPAKVTSR